MNTGKEAKENTQYSINILEEDELIMANKSLGN